MRNEFGGFFFWIVFTSQAISYMLGYQCLQVKQPPNKRLTSQVFIYQQLQRPVTACSNVLESALHGNKSYNTYSQPARLDLLPYYLPRNRNNVLRSSATECSQPRDQRFIQRRCDLVPSSPVKWFHMLCLVASTERV